MFKKILMALTATTLVASPIITAQAQAAPHREVSRTVVKHKANGRTVVKQQTNVRYDNDRRGNNRYDNSRYDNNRYSANRYNNGHHWAKGQRFDRRYASNYRVINNYRDYRLSSPPRGYQWVRSGNDAVLIALTSGIIGAVIGSAIN